MPTKTRTLHVQRGTRWSFGDPVIRYTSVGSYPVYYVTEDLDPVCSGCVIDAQSEWHNDRADIESEVLRSLLDDGYAEAKALRDARKTALQEACKGVAGDVRLLEVNWESRLTCECCGRQIESAYPPPR